jgi:folate-binding protein YgfZ
VNTPSARIALLADRGVVRVAGADAARLLQGVISNDVNLLDHLAAIHAGLLSPQGKILFEFFVARSGDAYLLETARDKTADLAKRLLMYRLRAKATITDAGGEYRLLVLWGEAAQPVAPHASLAYLAYSDPRLPGLGVRLLQPAAAQEPVALAERGLVAAGDWHEHRILLGVPEGGKDYPLGDTFPHEADFDMLNGVSFSKGCFIGQEVVSRMHNRASVRKRVVPIEADMPLTSGAAISAGKAVIGTIGSVAGRRGLAMLRLDRAAEATAKGEALSASGITIHVRRPPWAAPQPDWAAP